MQNNDIIKCWILPKWIFQITWSYVIKQNFNDFRKINDIDIIMYEQDIWYLEYLKERRKKPEIRAKETQYKRDYRKRLKEGLVLKRDE